jgi:hypothetical protein
MGDRNDLRKTGQDYNLALLFGAADVESVLLYWYCPLSTQMQLLFTGCL